MSELGTSAYNRILYDSAMPLSGMKYLADLSLVVPKNAQENIQIAKLLSDKNSPLVNMIRGISYNTTLRLSDQIKADEEGQMKEWLDKMGLTKLIGDSIDSDSNSRLSSLMNSTPVGDAFSGFHALVLAEKG